MARIRSVKPEFWTSGQVAECTPYARLAFIGMWTFCDDSGIHPADVTRLKMEVFPADSFSRDQIQEMVSQLLKSELIQEYEVNGKRYWSVTGWKHQRIDQPTYRYPLPDGHTPNTPIPRRVLGKHTPSTSSTDDERSETVRRTYVTGSGSGSGSGEEKDKSSADSVVENIWRSYPWNSHRKHHLQIPQSDLAVIIQAIERDGEAAVVLGTLAFAAAVKSWSKQAQQYVPKPNTFFRESQYLFDPDKWRRNEQSGITEPSQKVVPVNPADIIKKQALEDGGLGHEEAVRQARARAKKAEEAEAVAR